MKEMTIEQARKIREYFDTVRPCCDNCPFTSHCSYISCNNSANSIIERYNSCVRGIREQTARLEEVLEITDTLKPSLITLKEKEYLETILEPYYYNDFKIEIELSEVADEQEYLTIKGWKAVNNFSFTFPNFDGNTRYKGMQRDLIYAPEELGLFVEY